MGGAVSGPLSLTNDSRKPIPAAAAPSDAFKGSPSPPVNTPGKSRISSAVRLSCLPVRSMISAQAQADIIERTGKQDKRTAEEIRDLPGVLTGGEGDPLNASLGAAAAGIGLRESLVKLRGPETDRKSVV